MIHITQSFFEEEYPMAHKNHTPSNEIKARLGKNIVLKGGRG